LCLRFSAAAGRNRSSRRQSKTVAGQVVRAAFSLHASSPSILIHPSRGSRMHGTQVMRQAGRKRHAERICSQPGAGRLFFNGPA
jgi:hypothetical protein